MRRLALTAAFAGLAFAVGWWIGAGGAPWLHVEARGDALARVEADNAALRAALERLRVAVPPSGDARTTMDRSTLAALAAQVEQLESDNARLAEDVAFFESATADRGGPATAAIRRFQVTAEPDAHAARFRLLITQDSKATHDFVGTLRLLVTLERHGRTDTLDFPVAGAGAPLEADGVQVDGDPAQFDLRFRSYKRVDGAFRLPADAVLRSVEVRIVERGAVVARQAVPVG